VLCHEKYCWFPFTPCMTFLCVAKKSQKNVAWVKTLQRCVQHLTVNTICEHPAFQSVKCRFRCSHPRAKFVCRATWSSAKASVGENLARVCAPPHRERSLEHPAFQRVKCRFRCSHPRANFVCRTMWSRAKAFKGENLANVCAPSHREHPSEHSAVQHVKCRFRCSHPQAKLRHSLALNRQPILPIR
jgi:hypothetical protein